MLTAAWAIALATPRSPLTITIAYATASVLACCHSLHHALRHPTAPLDADVYQGTALGMLLFTYQYVLHRAFEHNRPELQAIVNCNVIVILAYKCMSLTVRPEQWASAIVMALLAAVVVRT